MSPPLTDLDPTPNPDGPPSIERIWARIKRMEVDAQKLRVDFQAELTKLRTEFNVTTESLKVDFESLGVRIGLLEEDVTETKQLVEAGNSTGVANNALLQGIDKKLAKLVPDDDVPEGLA